MTRGSIKELRLAIRALATARTHLLRAGRTGKDAEFALAQAHQLQVQKQAKELRRVIRVAFGGEA